MRTVPAVSLFLFAISAAAATDGDCSQGQLGQLVALLEDYAPAQTYCSALIPAPQRASAPTTTITQCQPEATADKLKRDDEETASSELNDSTPNDTHAKAFAKLRRSKTASYDVCDCLLSPPDNTVYITSACPSTQYCSASGDCKPTRNCNNPSRCESSSYCLEAPAGACFCHPDTDDSSMGYCMSAGPSGNGCPSSYEDCSSNAECGGSRVCIYACCREEPFCVDLEDYNPDTPNYAAPERLFRRSLLGSDRSGVNPRRI